MPEENKNQKSKLIPYILAGRDDRDTQIAKKLLDEAKIPYRFAHADISEGTLPQLFSGLINYVGLEQIARFAKNAEYWRLRNTRLFKQYKKQ